MATPLAGTVMSKRFRDGNGNVVPLGNLPNAITALRQSVARKLFGNYPREPWIPFSAARRLNGLITSDSV